MNRTCTQSKSGKIRAGALHLTQKVDYGLFLLAVLAKKDPTLPISISAVAKNNHLSFSFLQKVANLLKRANIIISVRGKDGGYRLSTDLGSIKLKDIIEALEGPTKIARCIGLASECEERCPRASFCMVRSGVERMNQEIQEFYLAKRLTDFLS